MCRGEGKQAQEIGGRVTDDTILSGLGRYWYRRPFLLALPGHRHICPLAPVSAVRCWKRSADDVDGVDPAVEVREARAVGSLHAPRMRLGTGQES